MEQIDFENLVSMEFSKGNGALFIGCGISKPSTKINWLDLLKPLSKNIDIEINDNDDLPLIAQYIVNSYTGNRGPLIDEIIKAFNKKFEVNNYHKYLSSMNVSTIWTTNYDTLLEKAFSDFNVSVKISDESINRDMTNSDIEIIKLHGCIKNSGFNDIVITQEDYDDFLINKPAISQRLCEDLNNKSFLFLGYSCRDVDIKNIMIQARRLRHSHTRQHFFVLYDDKKKEVNKEYQNRRELWLNELKRFGIISFIVYDDRTLEEMLNNISKKSKGKTVFVTGSHEEHIHDDAKSLGNKLANMPDLILLNGQASGIGSKVVQSFMEECINKKYDIIERVKIFPNPYAANPRFSNDPKLIPDLKKSRIQLLNSAQVVVAFGGGIGTKAEIELAFERNCTVIPVVRNVEDKENEVIKMILSNEQNMEFVKNKDKDYYDKILSDSPNISMGDVAKCIQKMMM